MGFLAAAPALAAAGSSAAATGAAAAGTAAAAGSAAAAGTAAAGTAAATAAAATPWLTYAGLGLTALSTVAGLGAGQQQTAALQAQANYQAQVAQNNQKRALEDERLALAEASAEEAAQGMRNRAVMGAIKAGQAASGVDINQGSPLDVRTSAAELGQLDQQTIRAKGMREAYGYGARAADFGAEANMQRAAGKVARKSGAYDSAGTLLSGASSLVSQTSRAKRQGIF